MQEKTDIRIQRTRDSILAAMIGLLKRKNFDQISVTDICKEAQISRSGFYLHYLDKYDLVEKYQREYAKKALSLIMAKKEKQWSKKELFCRLVALLHQDGELLSLLLSSRGSSDIQLQLKTVLREYAEENLLPRIVTVKAESAADKRYLTAFLTNALFGLIQEWVDSGKKESPAELVAILDKVIAYDFI